MSSPLAPFLRVLSEAALAALGLSAEHDIAVRIRVPEAGRGDLAIPCFDLARTARIAPPEAARKIAEALAGDARWHMVEAVGPYVNVVIAMRALAAAVVPAARAPGYGSDTAGLGRNVVIDFSSPNIA